MAVNTTNTSVVYEGDGVSTVLPVTFVFFGSDEIEVIERTIATGAEAPKAIGTHYTVSGGEGSTGSVTAVTPPAGTVEWHIRRKTKRTQLIVYDPNDRFPAKTHERGLDRGMAVDQEIDQRVDLALSFPKTETGSFSGVLPAAPLRANKAIVFGPDGQLGVSDDDYVDQLADVTAAAAAAAASASAASTSASGAATSQSAASGSASAASTSASGASASAAAAAASALAAAASAAADLYANVVSKSANYTVVEADEGTLFRVDATAGPITITLPDVSTFTTDFRVAVAKVDSSGNAVTIQRSGSNTINGGTSKSIAIQWQVMNFAGDTATGTYLAMDVTAASVPSASETVEGKAEIATTAETNAGTDDLRIVTAKKLVEFNPGSVTFDTAADEIMIRDASNSNKQRSAPLPSGFVVDRVYAEYTTNTTLSTTIPADDTIPQKTEGTQILSVSITPKSTTNRLRCRFEGEFSQTSAGGGVVAALFVNSNTNADAGRCVTNPGTSYSSTIALEYEFVPGSVSSQTIAIRIGANSGNTFMNGFSGNRILGGAQRSTLVVEEVKS